MRYTVLWRKRTDEQHKWRNYSCAARSQLDEFMCELFNEASTEEVRIYAAW